MKKNIGLIAGLVVLVIFLIMPTPSGMNPEAMKAAGVALLMTIWWITEAIPIYATAFVPLALFPLLGILNASATAENYGHNYVLMLLGGFFLAKAIEKHQLHKRIALVIIHKLGTNRKKIILSFMLATAFLSMWIANVAVALLMLPIALAIVSKEEEGGAKSQFGIACMLGIAYAASVGGTATLIGTPPNLVFTGIIETMFPDAPEFGFFEWMKVGLPGVIIFLPIIWIYLTRYFKITGTVSGSRELVRDELKSLGGLSTAEKRVLVIFILTAMGWIFRRDIVVGDFVLPGWSSLLGVSEYVHDSTVAMVSAMFLFFVNSGDKKTKILDWKSASSVPWGVVMIVGGGYAIAASFRETGLANWLGSQMAFLGGLPMIGILVIVVGAMVFITEVNSNTATANIFLPVLATTAIAAQINPLLLMIPATFACSFAFMLPSGTGTNTVIFASERITIPQMARAGLGMNVISIIVLTLILYAIVIPILGLESGLPLWASGD